MADYIEVNISTLEQDVKDMEATVEQIRKDMNDMFESVSELDTMWDGPANQTFNQQFVLDKQIFDEICGAVEGIVASMKNAQESYLHCEAAVSEEIDRITV